MLVKFLSIAVTRIPANIIHAAILRWPKTRLCGAAISTEEIKTVQSTAAEILSRAEIESLLRALQAARNGAPESLLRMKYHYQDPGRWTNEVFSFVAGMQEGDVVLAFEASNVFVGPWARAF